MRKFVEENWKEGGKIGWARQQERAMEGMKAKAEKKRLQAEESEKKQAKTGDAEIT